MSNDLLMLRGEQDGSYNLAVGEPVFLQDAAFWCAPRSTFYADPRYPAYGGDPALIEKLRATMKHAKKHIVVTNGAKQALLAAMYGYRVRSYQPKQDIVLDDVHWPSYPTLCRLADMRPTTMQCAAPFIRGCTDHGVTKEFGYSKYMRVTASPNNPDGSETTEPADIWDAAYFHWVYGAKAVPVSTVSVWSAAKILGLSGIRVGVLTTDDDDLAEYARQYVEKTTSGVSNESQMRLRDVLDSMMVSPDRVAENYATARRTLLRNGEIFNEHLARFCSEIHGVPSTGRGMFAWFKAPFHPMYIALGHSNVKVIPGVACGADSPLDAVSKGMGWFRMSMGHRNDYTAKACAALADALDRKI